MYDLEDVLMKSFREDNGISSAFSIEPVDDNEYCVSTNVIDGLNDTIHFYLSIARDVARLASEFGVLLDDRGELTRDYINARDLRNEVNNFTQLLNRVVEFAQTHR